MLYNGGASDTRTLAGESDFMPEARELRVVIEAADQAAADGDYVAAELKLRELAALQEAQLGPNHPDLASTLNNLGIVYERVDSPAEAELCYRRAYAIATKALDSNHPFVATSRKNLEDFCHARGRPFDRSVVAEARPVLRKPLPGRSRPLVLYAAGAVVVAMLVVAVFWFRRSDSERSSSSTSRTQTSAQRQVQTTPSVSGESRRELEPRVIAGQRTEARDKDSSSSGDTVAAQANAAAPVGGATPATTASGPVVIAEARLCRRLTTSNWRCDEVSSPLEPGSVFFYTRVKAVNNTTVEHRWYRDDRLSQSVELPIKASPENGYRTYTRRTVTAANAGNWRVEVRGTDGSLLYEQRFVVR